MRSRLRRAVIRAGSFFTPEERMGALMLYIANERLRLANLKGKVLLDFTSLTARLPGNQNQMDEEDFSCHLVLPSLEKLTEFQNSPMAAALNEYLGLSGIFGEIRLAFLSESEKKDSGSFYTDPYLAMILSQGMENEDFARCPSLFDPACGCGMLLLTSANILTHKGFTKEQVAQRISGSDIDGAAVLGCRLTLLFEGFYPIDPESIRCEDALTAEHGPTDILVMNPPYVGRKESKRQIEALPERYYQVFEDKADLSYCFFVLADDLLRKNGLLLVLTSRYFLEARSAERLRGFLEKRFSAAAAIDFYGLRSKGFPGVDLFFFKAFKTPEKRDLDLYMPSRQSTTTRDSETIYRALFSDYSEPLDFHFNHYVVPYEGVPRWNYRSPEAADMKERGERLLEMDGKRLGDYVQSFQGIITGCDDAFVRKTGQVEKAFDERMIHPWIKSSDINSGDLFTGGRSLIYLSKHDRLTEEQVKALSPWRERLQKRREVRNGKIPWFALQWERDLGLFEQRKIIWPYKSDQNHFYLDRQHSCFSADIYGMIVSDDRWSLNLLTILLNTTFYDRLFKSYAKKLGYSLYEYYPNQVLDLPLPDPGRLERAVLENLEDYRQARQMTHSQSQALYDKMVKLREYELTENLFEELLNLINFTLFRITQSPEN